jgi:hypothetical protein
MAPGIPQWLIACMLSAIPPPVTGMCRMNVSTPAIFTASALL